MVRALVTRVQISHKAHRVSDPARVSQPNLPYRVVKDKIERIISLRGRGEQDKNCSN